MIKLATTVLPGHRIEVSAPELEEGEAVELIVLRHASRSFEAGADLPSRGIWDWIQSLSPIERTAEEWQAVERELEQERNSWDR